MSCELETFNYFVDDLLSSDINLLKYELDILLMQHLFNSDELNVFMEVPINEDFFAA